MRRPYTKHSDTFVRFIEPPEKNHISVYGRRKLYNIAKKYRVKTHDVVAMVNPYNSRYFSKTIDRTVDPRELIELTSGKTTPKEMETLKDFFTEIMNGVNGEHIIEDATHRCIQTT